MKENKSFINALKTASAAANARNSLPILDCFLVVGNAITVTNLEVTIKATFEGDPFVSVCLPTNLVLKGLKHVNGEFEVSINGNMAKFKSGEFEFEVPTSNSEDFPTIEIVDAEYETVVNPCINEAIRFVNNDELRPVLNGVAFQSENGKLRICATDSKVLYLNQTDIEFSQSFVLVQKTCNLIKDVNEFDVAFDGKKVSIKYDGIEIISNTVDGAYPNVSSVIPVNSNVLNINWAILASSIERVSEFSDTQKLIKFNVKQNSIDVLGQDINFSISAKETLNLDKPSTPISIGFQSELLLQALKTGKGYIEYSEPSRAVVINNENKTVLVMPMQING